MTDHAPEKTRIVTACMLIIGNEILSGRTQDANLQYLAKALNEYGVRMKEARVIPDDETVIIDTLNECRRRFDYVFTTGGIGPTHDDITADCIAKAFGVELIMDPDAEAMIRQWDAPPEVMAVRLRMARVPKGATLIRGHIGAPGFRIENVFVMAGVPSVMRSMTDALDGELEGGDPVRSRAITTFLGESEIAGPLGELQAQYPDVDLGSYPFYRQDRYGTSLIMRGTNEQRLETLSTSLREIITAHNGEIIEGELTD